MERKVNLEFDKKFYAVMIRSCSVTDAIDTLLFDDVETAKVYCQTRWDIPVDCWVAYLVASDPKSTMKLNGEGVRYCGWRCEKDEHETIHIHLERRVIGF